MIAKSFDKITKDDLQEFITNLITEKKTLDYKRELPGNSDDDKKEFLNDVSSFANSQGGDLIFGIEEDSLTKNPKCLYNVKIKNPDEDIRRLEGMIRDGIKPRILYEIREIPFEDGKYAIIIRVKKSWNSPHQVIFHHSNKFYSRSSKGKNLMDLDELRVAFNLSETRISKIKTFVEDRISNIYSNSTPYPTNEGPKLVFHLIPFSSLDPGENIDLSILRDETICFPMNCTAWNHQFNLHGYLRYSSPYPSENFTHSYLQFFRNGIIEAVSSHAFDVENKRVFREFIEITLVEYSEMYLEKLKELAISTPILFFVTLVGVKGYRSAKSNRTFFEEKPEIYRDIVYLPEVIVEDYSVKSSIIFKSTLDAFNNALGYSHSPNFDEIGNWIRPRIGPVS